MASIQYVVSATDAASAVFAKIGASADGLDKQLEDLGKRVADPEVRLDDAKFTLGMIRAAERLDKLSAKVADPKVQVDTAAAQKEILRINAMLDRLGSKTVNVTVDVNRRGFAGAFRAGLGGTIGLLGRIPQLKFLSGLGTSISGGAGGGAGLAGILGQGAGAGVAGGGGLGVAGGLAAGVAFPAAALIDALLGQGAGSAGALGSLMLTQKFAPKVLNAGDEGIKDTLKLVTQSIAPSVGLIFAEFGKSFQSLTPQLAKFFAATLPFLRQFLGLALTAAKTILPALTQALQAMVSSGALKAMTQGFVFVIQGIAGFIKAIGPGFKAGAEVFRVLALGVKGILIGLGAAFGWMGKTAGEAFTVIHKAWDNFRHWFAGEFDYWRHWWASSWFQAWDTVVHAWHNIVGAASSAWDLLVKAAKTGVATVLSFFTGLPDKALRALWGLGHSLYAFARSAFGEFLNGLKSVAGSIFSWLKNFIGGIPHDIMSLLGMSPPHPGSVFYELGANMMRHLEAGMKSRTQGIGVGAIRGALGGVSGSAASAQAYARSILSAYGWGNQWAPLNAVAMRESGWSMTATNPSSGAYGIAQFINGPSEYYQYGGNPNTVAGQVIAFFNYIRQRYGNPSGAWQHELNYGWYDRGGWLPPGVSLAVNTTGQPERVGGTGGNTYITVQVGHGTHPVAAAQEIVKLLNTGAKSGVKLRTSILGPG